MRKDAFYGVQFAQSLYQEQKKCEGLEQSLRLDIPTTQYLESQSDELHVTGNWTSISYEFEGLDPGNQVFLVIGQYRNEFALENNIWQLKEVSWRPLYKCGPFVTSEDQNFSAYRKQPETWLGELPSLYSLENMKVSEKTLEILNLRNDLLGLASRFNERGMTDSPRIPERGKKMLKDVRSLLVTSPVIKMTDELDRASAFLSVTVLKQIDAGHIQNTRGSIALSLTKMKNGWEILDFEWFDYATLDPWPLSE